MSKSERNSFQIVWFNLLSITDLCEIRCKNRLPVNSVSFIILTVFDLTTLAVVEKMWSGCSIRRIIAGLIITEDAKTVLKTLDGSNQLKRLAGADIQNHPYFKLINWTKLKHEKLRNPTPLDRRSSFQAPAKDDKINS